MICTHPPCDRPCETYLCNDCTQELHDHWSQIPDLVPVLTLIMRGQEKAFHQPTAEGRGGAAGSKAPINVSALSLAQNLIMARNTTPREYAGQSDGWQSKERIEAWVTLADKMVNGEEEATHSPAFITYKLNQAPTLGPAGIVEWLASDEGPGITVTERQLSNWKYQGRLHPANTTGRPKYHAVDVYLAWENATINGWRPSPEHGNKHYDEQKEAA